jgi:hypothetical protein
MPTATIVLQTLICLYIYSLIKEIKEAQEKGTKQVVEYSSQSNTEGKVKGLRQSML